MSKQRNALVKPIGLVTPHDVYQGLGRSDRVGQKSYLALFESQVESKLIEQVTESTLKGWVLCDERFKAQIEKQTNRRVEPSSIGGDRKSKAYLNGRKNQ